ncbi:hypothetical protein J6590_020301 [Homalodisca vitripennis]|nr:hypothetical protein J6590_020301 [Homalodisca vitripennis]
MEWSGAIFVSLCRLPKHSLFLSTAPPQTLPPTALPPTNAPPVAAAIRANSHHNIVTRQSTNPAASFLLLFFTPSLVRPVNILVVSHRLLTVPVA